MDVKLKAIEEDDYDAYMATVTKSNVYYFNEQERWFMEMSNPVIRDLSFDVLEIRFGEAGFEIIATIRQEHESNEDFDFEYPLLFKYEEGQWKDCGYAFEEYVTDRFVVKYMEGEPRLDEFVAMLDMAYENLDVLYERKPPHDNYEMKLFHDREMLRQRTIPTNPWLFTGWSEPDESLKLFTGHPEDYKNYPGGVVQHELVHHITINICNNNLAVWILEGIAMYDGVAHYDHSHSRVLSNLTKDGVSKTLSELEGINLGSDLTSKQINDYYATSYMYVRFIAEIYGHDTLMDLFYETGKKPFHDSTLNSSFESNNQRTTGEVIQTVLGLTKNELSSEYLVWLEGLDDL